MGKFGKKKKNMVAPDEVVVPVESKKKFPPTPEQQKSIDRAVKHKKSRIKALAGTGKTATLEMIANEIAEPSLYLAFNRTMAMEAQSRFPSHVACMTGHSLAYRAIGKDYQHKLSRPKGGRYVNVAGTPTEISKFYNFPNVPSGNKMIRSTFLGVMVRDMVNRFEQSSDEEITEKHLPKFHIEDVKSRYPDTDIKRLVKMVTRYAKDLWADRTDLLSEVLCTHDTYFKLYVLSKPQLTQYDVIYGDEFQDTNAVTFQLLTMQEHAKLVIVGDPYQNIYSFRGAQNFLDKVSWPQSMLSKSFRFGEQIAKIASCVIGANVQGFEKIKDKVGYGGEKGIIDKSKPYTMLYRTNMILLLDALDLMEEGKDVSVSIDTKDFVNMMFSVLALRSNNLAKVKHEKIIPYDTWEEFKEEAKGEADLGRLLKLVESGQSSKVIDVLTGYKPKDKAHITLTTAHKSKGLEFEQVILGNDFPSNYDKDGKWVGLNDQEKNLLYVAVTRAEKCLAYNSTVNEFIVKHGLSFKKISEKKETLEDEIAEEVNTVGKGAKKLTDYFDTSKLDQVFKDTLGGN